MVMYLYRIIGNIRTFRTLTIASGKCDPMLGPFLSLIRGILSFLTSGIALMNRQKLF